jgi:hypothetical protein
MTTSWNASGVRSEQERGGDEPADHDDARDHHGDARSRKGFAFSDRGCSLATLQGLLAPTVEFASEMFVRSATQGGYQYDDDENRSNEAQPP